MDPTKEQIFRTYAWAYFSLHADQRMKTFNFFLIVASLISSGIITLIRDGGNFLIVTPLGLALSLLCLLFWRLDQRNRILIKNGEDAIKFLDSKHDLSTSDDTPHVLCIFERDDFNQKGKSRSIFRNGRLSYYYIFGCVYALFACIGIFFTFIPFFLANHSSTNSFLQPASTIPTFIAPHQIPLNPTPTKH